MILIQLKVRSNPAVTYATFQHQGRLFWITCKRLELLWKAGRLQLIQSSTPSVALMRQCCIRMDKHSRSHWQFKSLWPNFQGLCTVEPWAVNAIPMDKAVSRISVFPCFFNTTGCWTRHKESSILEFGIPFIKGTIWHLVSTLLRCMILAALKEV